MAYVLPDPLPWTLLSGPLSRADDELARLDERLGRSPIAAGWISRSHFSDACAALWIAGELVHLEDLVLHDAGMDVRAPTHEIVRAREILQARRRLAVAAPGTLGPGALAGLGTAPSPTAPRAASDDAPGVASDDPLAEEFAALDRALEKARQRLDGIDSTPEAAPFVYDSDWDKAERLTAWERVCRETNTLPPLLAAALRWDAWLELEPLQHKAWAGPLTIADRLGVVGKTRHHLAAVHSALKAVPRERRQSRVQTTRILAFLDAIAAAADHGMKEHDRWSLARQQMERKLAGRRSTSHLPALIDLMMARPVVSAGLIAGELAISQRAAQNLVAELGLREVTGRGRYRAWAIL